MLIIIDSKKPLGKLGDDLERAVARNKFGVLGVHNLKETMARKGVSFERSCRIYDVCNPHQAKKVLEADMKISTALPCRISIYEEGEGTRLATIRPTAMIAMFEHTELSPLAEEVESDMIRIMEEAAR